VSGSTSLTAKIGGVSDGLALAGSKNPIMQLVASLVTETTTGAAGRQANVALRSHMLHTRFVGNAMLDYDNAYTVFRNRKWRRRHRGRDGPATCGASSTNRSTRRRSLAS
jgi:hypothetical protein